MSKTRDSIFESALSIFSKNGYDKATMDDIALEANVAKGTLYYYFKSKEEIFKYIINDKMKTISEQLKVAADCEINPLLKLNAIIKGQLNLVSENKDFFTVIISQIWGQESRQDDIKTKMNKYIAFLEVYLKEAMENGIIKKGDTELVAYNIIGSVCSTAMYELLNGDKYSQRFIDLMTKCILKAITQVSAESLDMIRE